MVVFNIVKKIVNCDTINVNPLVAGLSEIVLTIADKHIEDDEKIDRIADLLIMMKKILIEKAEIKSSIKIDDIESIINVIQELEI